MDLWRYLVQSPNQSVTKYKVKLLIKKKKNSMGIFASFNHWKPSLPAMT